MLYLGRYRKEKGIEDFIKLISLSNLNFKMKVFGIDYANSFINSKKVEYFTQITKLNESINELKTLNECINNGKINTSFS